MKPITRECSICHQPMSFKDFKKTSKHLRKSYNHDFKKIARKDLLPTWNEISMAIPCCQCSSMMGEIASWNEPKSKWIPFYNTLTTFEFSKIAFHNLLKFDIISKEQVQEMIDRLVDLLDQEGSRIIPDSFFIRWRKKFFHAFVDVKTDPWSIEWCGPEIEHVEFESKDAAINITISPETREGIVTTKVRTPYHIGSYVHRHGIRTREGKWYHHELFLIKDTVLISKVIEEASSLIE